MPAATHARRVVKVPEANRPRNAKGKSAALDSRQLRHAQAPGGAGMAGQASPVSHALHPHFGFMAEHGRAVLSRYHDRATSPRRVHQRA